MKTSVFISTGKLYSNINRNYNLKLKTKLKNKKQ